MNEFYLYYLCEICIIYIIYIKFKIYIFVFIFYKTFLNAYIYLVQNVCYIIIM